MKKFILKACAAMACVYAGYAVSSGLRARLAKAQQAAGFSSPDEGSVKGSGRCIAVGNATGVPVELIFKVYGTSGGFFKRLGKTTTTDRHIKVGPDKTISFNQKPKLGITSAKGIFKTVAGDYRYIEGLTLKIYDKAGKKAERVFNLDSDKVNELNRYISKVLNDQSACKDSQDNRDDYAIIVLGPDKSGLMSECVGTADEICAIEVGDGYSLLIPFAREKTFWGRALLHGQQHKKTFTEIAKLAKNAAVAGVTIVGSGGTLTGPALAKFSESTGKQLADIMTKLPESNLVRQELDSLTGITDTVDQLKSLKEMTEFEGDLPGLFDTALETIASGAQEEEAKELIDIIRRHTKLVFEEAAEFQEEQKKLQKKIEGLSAVDLSDDDWVAIEAAIAVQAKAADAKAQLDEQKKEAASEAEEEAADAEVIAGWKEKYVTDTGEDEGEDISLGEWESIEE